MIRSDAAYRIVPHESMIGWWSAQKRVRFLGISFWRELDYWPQKSTCEEEIRRDAERAHLDPDEGDYFDSHGNPLAP